MKRKILVSLSAAAILAMTSMTAFAEGAIQANNGLLEITLPGDGWYQLTSEENTAMFSDGDCAILVNLYKNGDKLPAIQSADANHELIYTAAASTQQYILHVVGYAHEQTDFSSICKSINTIKVDSSMINDDMLKHEVSQDKYTIQETSYTAWVTSDGLNVRSTSAESASIITTLSEGDEVTVTGTILLSGSEIGWVRIKTSDGTEGYVSSQFLSTSSTSGSTKETNASVDSAYRTGYTYTLYDDNGNAVVLYYYSDNKYYDANGVEYVGVADTAMKNTVTGEVINAADSYTGSQIQYSTTWWNAYGAAVTVYTYSNGKSYDSYGNEYVGVAEDCIQNVATGDDYYSYNPGTGNSSYSGVENNGRTQYNYSYSTTVYSASGEARDIYAYADGTFFDNYEAEYVGIAEDAYQNKATGEIFYTSPVN